MKTYKVLADLDFNGKKYVAGNTIELTEAQADKLNKDKSQVAVQ